MLYSQVQQTRRGAHARSSSYSASPRLYHDPSGLPGGGDLRRALSNFPWQDIAQEVLDTFFIPGGKSPEDSFKLISMSALPMKRESVELLMVANFVKVFLAKEGHDGLVGINYLEKIQII